MKKDKLLLIAVIILNFFIIFNSSCSVHKKLTKLKADSLSVDLNLSNKESNIPELENVTITRDTLTVQDDKGNEMIIMKAIRDEETGEMVANDVIDAAVVTARFRNVSERSGKVDLNFEVRVPKAMQDSKWQIRLYPDLFILNDSTRIDSVMITGNQYRKSQLRGYEHYQKFLKRLTSDSTLYTNLVQLELFLKRNIPQLYAFKSDTTRMDDEVFYSAFNLSEQEAIDHFNRRKSKNDKMMKRFLKSPITDKGIRLDTVIQEVNGDFVYNYTQTVEARPKLRKADVVLSGKVFEEGKQIYSIPRSEPLTFYISSISAFLDNSTHYKTTVIERRAEANASSNIDFEVGKSDVRYDIGNNFNEIHNIKKVLLSLLENETYDLDSIIVESNASPEGSYQANKVLAQRRSEAVSSYFDRYVSELRDSLISDKGFAIDEAGVITAADNNVLPKIKFSARSVAENWSGLEELVSRDTVLDEKQKKTFDRICGKENDPDSKEAELRKTDFYQYLRQDLYPKLRTVHFSFYQHRRGMVKDTVHTTVVDTLYMEGVQALRDMDYEKALEILRPYNDYNTAVVYTALNRNVSAMEILRRMNRNAEINYMMAIIYSRMGDQQAAVQHYLTSCKQNVSFVYRGNLDPEISILIKTYGLNAEPEDDFDL